MKFIQFILLILCVSIKSGEISYSSGMNKTFLPWQSIENIYKHFHKIIAISENNKGVEQIINILRKRIYSPSEQQVKSCLTVFEQFEKNIKYSNLVKAARIELIKALNKNKRLYDIELRNFDVPNNLYDYTLNYLTKNLMFYSGLELSFLKQLILKFKDGSLTQEYYMDSIEELINNEELKQIDTKIFDKLIHNLFNCELKSDENLEQDFKITSKFLETIFKEKLSKKISLLFHSIKSKINDQELSITIDNIETLLRGNIIFDDLQLAIAALRSLMDFKEISSEIRELIQLAEFISHNNKDVAKKVFRYIKTTYSQHSRFKEFVDKDEQTNLIEWSHNNKFFVCAGASSVRIYDLNSNELISNFFLKGIINGIKLSFDDRFLAIATTQEVLIFDVNRKTVRSKQNLPASSITWSPNSNNIAISYNKSVTVIWDIETIAKLSQIITKPLAKLAWSPNGKYLAIKNMFGSMDIYSTENWKLIKSLDRHDDSVNLLIWSPDSESIVTSSKFPRIKVIYNSGIEVSYNTDEIVNISNIETGEFKTIKIADVNAKVHNMKWSLNCKELSVCHGKVIETFDVKELKQVNIIKGDYDFQALNWSSNEEFVVVSISDEIIILNKN